MKKDTLMIFCDKQAFLITILLKMKIIRGIKAAGVVHPLTQKVIAQIQEYESFGFIIQITRRLTNLCFDEEGKKTLFQLEQLGIIQKVTTTSSDECSIQFKTAANGETRASGFFTIDS